MDFVLAGSIQRTVIEVRQFLPNFPPFPRLSFGTGLILIFWKRMWTTILGTLGQNDMAYTSATKGKLTMRLEKHLDQGLASIEDQMQRRLLGRAEDTAFGERQQNARRSSGRKLALFAAASRILSNLQHS